VSCFFSGKHVERSVYHSNNSAAGKKSLKLSRFTSRTNIHWHNTRDGDSTNFYSLK
jgi:hypothetical protein